MRSILITGASSGMGAALARACAGPDVRLGLVGRNAGRLEEVAQSARDKGAVCALGLADVRDRAALESFVAGYDAESPIDMLIVNAGVFDGRKPGETVEDLETSLRVLDVNLAGALNTLHAALPAMRARRRGHIVIVSSLAGLTPIGGGLGYSAGKAALVSYGLGLKQLLWDEGVSVTVVCPGFVETPIAERHLGWQPFRITADRAAQKILRGVARKKAIVAFPLPLHVMTRMAILMPDIVRRIVGRVFACHAAPQALAPADVRPAPAANDEQRDAAPARVPA